MTNSSVSNFPAQPATWSDVARVCRRVCVLRERGDVDEAERVRKGALAEMVATLRTPADSDATLAVRVETLLATEAERVANAAVLAELLAPLLHESQNSSAPPEAVSAGPALAGTRATPSSTLSATPPPRCGGIADFIDEMIAQERTPEQPAGRAQRRAS